MTNNLKISILMPAYNAEEYIGEAIKSILNQTFKEFEFIIIDDGSIDRTWEIINQYAKKDGRIVVLQNEGNLGIAVTRNRLVEKAQCKYVLWQDADDLSLPTRIEKQYNFMESHPEVGIVGGYLQFFNKQGVTSVRKYAIDDVSLRKTIFRYSPVAQPSAMIRRKVFSEIGIYNPKYPPAEDIDMSFRIGTRYQFANIPEIVIKYRENDTSATFTKLKKIELDTLEIRKKYFNHPAYGASLVDKIYNLLQFISLFIMPAKLRIAIFNLIRNSR